MDKKEIIVTLDFRNCKTAKDVEKVFKKHKAEFSLGIRATRGRIKWRKT